MSGRFVKGQSGNPSGRPKARRPNVSAFDIVFDKVLRVTENSIERDFTVEEALQLQTYQAAIGGSKLAVRAVLKMIEKREKALRAAAPAQRAQGGTLTFVSATDSADEAMVLLDILLAHPNRHFEPMSRPLLVRTWAAQAGLSRPGRSKIDDRVFETLNLFVEDFDALCFPKGGR